MILLKFATAINGESTVAAHDKWITIDTITFGVGRSISSVGGGGDRETSNPSFSEVSLTKAMDVASTQLFMQAVCGKSLGKCEIHFLQTGGDKVKGQVYLKLELEETIVSSYSMSSSGERPHETLSLNFTKISYNYDKFDGDKIVKGTPQKWDLEKNETF
jgi:type VI secretion system secreted protein Hcp